MTNQSHVLGHIIVKIHLSWYKDLLPVHCDAATDTGKAKADAWAGNRGEQSSGACFACNYNIPANPELCPRPQTGRWSGVIRNFRCCCRCGTCNTTTATTMKTATATPTTPADYADDLERHKCWLRGRPTTNSNSHSIQTPISNAK